MVCYFYQFVYIPISWFMKKRSSGRPADLNKFAIMICARNEGMVIGDLLDSLKNQTYPAEYMTVFVMADNCTDNTADVARERGAVVYERFEKDKVGKGYALEVLRHHIAEDYPEGFDAYFVFDADNILRKNYIEEMNKTFCEGNEIVTSYRNSKNLGNTWVSAGSGWWFLRESRYLQYPRFLLGTSGTASGTGFMFSRKVSDEIGDWPFHLLTEDVEFSADQILKGRKIAMCMNAELFDEQPLKFKQCWTQRIRWGKGYLQVLRVYGWRLLKGALKGSFSCFDIVMNIAPAFILTIISVVLGLTLAVWGAIIGDNILIGIQSLAELLLNAYLMLFALSLITTITEWSHIHMKTWKKILYTFTFPFFMFTYVPIALVSLFGHVTWKPIEHTVTVDQMKKTENQKETDILE